MVKIGIDWLRYAKGEEEKQKIRDLVVNSEPILKLIKDILEERRTANMQEFTEKNYENASWAHLQAHRNGRLEEIAYLIKLMTIKER